MWMLRSEDRLIEWKNFRLEISGLSFDEALAETVNLWCSAPFVTHYLDRIEPLYWPDPWRLLSDNKYDDMAKSLGMLYTLFLSDHGKNHTFSIVKVQESIELKNYNLVDIDSGKYILNYNFDEITNNKQLSSDIKVIELYSAADLQLHKY